MPVDPPFDVYHKHLSFLSQGCALWNPNPLDRIYNRVSIGDVGYIDEGAFIRMFNVTLRSDDPSNGRLGEPIFYDRLNFDGGLIRRTTFDTANYCSSSVFRGQYANAPEPAGGITYRCRGRGALLSLPRGGHHEDAIATAAFEKYIRNNVINWFSCAQKNELGVQRMEDLILVSGCTLVTSWAAAAFVDPTVNAEISLESNTLSGGGTNFIWSNIQGPVVHHNSRFDPQNPPAVPDQCVFIRGFRAKRRFFRTIPIRAAAKPRPDDPDDRRDDETQMTRAPGIPNYRDPPIDVLDNAVEVAEETIAITENDLQLIQKVETMAVGILGKCFSLLRVLQFYVTHSISRLRFPMIKSNFLRGNRIRSWPVTLGISYYGFKKSSRCLPSHTFTKIGEPTRA